MSKKELNKREKKRIDWHSGFEGGLRLSFRKYKDCIQIEREHPLSMEPLKIDFLVIKNDTGVYIDNAIGRGFLRHNIIEYKNPYDELNIDVLWKAIGYAGIYKSLGKKVNEIKSDDLTLNIFRASKPRKMFKYLTDSGYLVEEQSPGVYEISGIINIPLRIIVIKELNDADLKAMKIMMRKVYEKDVEDFLLEAKEYTDEEDKRSADAVLQISSSINKELYNRLRGDNDMCEALREIMAEDLKEAENKGIKLGEQRGKKRGIKLAETKINSLNLWLFDMDRADDVRKAAGDPKFMEKLLDEYNSCHDEKLS